MGKQRQNKTIGFLTRIVSRTRSDLERKSYIDRISSCGFKSIAVVSNGHLWFQIKGYGFKAYFAQKTVRL